MLNGTTCIEEQRNIGTWIPVQEVEDIDEQREKPC